MEREALLDRMNEALVAAKGSSETLERLLERAIDQGTPDLQLVQRLQETNKLCDRLVENYVKACKAYNQASHSMDPRFQPRPHH